MNGSESTPPLLIPPVALHPRGEGGMELRELPKRTAPSASLFFVRARGASRVVSEPDRGSDRSPATVTLKARGTDGSPP